MRFTYELSDATRQALGNAKLTNVAREMDVDQSHLSHILAGDTTDPFAPFLRLYNAMLRAGEDVSAFDAAQAESKARYRPLIDARKALAEKIRCDGETDALAVEAMGDERKCKDALTAISHQRDATDVLETSLLNLNIDNRTFARTAIEHRNGRRAA